jgi:ABC-type transport system involved in multi-copper enzyme maturation permease subunit
MSAPAVDDERRGPWSAFTLGALVIAEARKARSTSAWWALLVPAGLICLLSNLVTAEIGGLAFTASAAQANTLSSVGTKFAVLFGVVSATAEYRHRTITTSYLTAPGRAQLLVAKALVAAVAGAGYAIVCAACGVIGISIAGDTATAGWGAVLQVSLAAVLLFAMWGALGVAVGTVVGNQLAAIVGVLLYLILVEQVIVLLINAGGNTRVDEYLPAGASSSVLNALVGDTPLSGLFAVDTPPWWLPALVFACYTAIGLMGAALVADRRDIT